MAGTTQVPRGEADDETKTGRPLLERGKCARQHCRVWLDPTRWHEQNRAAGPQVLDHAADNLQASTGLAGDEDEMTTELDERVQQRVVCRHDAQIRALDAGKDRQRVTQSGMVAGDQHGAGARQLVGPGHLQARTEAGQDPAGAVAQPALGEYPVV
jgi:hypothetical protein